MKSSAALLSAPSKRVATAVVGLVILEPKVLMGLVSPMRPIAASLAAVVERVMLLPVPKMALELPKMRLP